MTTSCGNLEIDRAWGSVKDERARHERRAIGLGIVVGVKRPLGERHVAGRRHKAAEVAHRDRMLIDPETVDVHRVNRALLGIEVGRAHRERARGHSAHLLHGRRCRGCDGVGRVHDLCATARSHNIVSGVAACGQGRVHLDHRRTGLRDVRLRRLPDEMAEGAQEQERAEHEQDPTPRTALVRDQPGAQGGEDVRRWARHQDVDGERHEDA